MATRPELNKLLSVSGEPCVSIIIPTHPLSPERIQDKRVLQEAVKRTKEFLKKQDPSDHDSLVERIENVIHKVDHNHLQEGLGIYVSPHISKLINFAFPVIEKAKIADHFDTRDLLYDLQTNIDYYILAISKNQIRVFIAHGEIMQEIKNEDFPMDYEETYEYSKPNRGTSFGNTLKSFEKDKSIVQEFRLKDFLRTADEALKKYLTDDIPFVIVGDNKEISNFLEITSNKPKIIAQLTGNYNFNGEMQLADLSWAEVKKYQKKQNEIAISELKEAVGKKLIAIGIEEVWEAAKEGKGSRLIVEKDLEHNGFINEREHKIRLHDPVDRSKYIFVSDIVERTIKTVLEKSGEVFFVDNGELESFGGIALLLRYNIKSEL